MAVYADEVEQLLDDGQKAAARKENTLEITPIIIGDTVKVSFIKHLTASEQKAAVKKYFWKFFARHCTYFSSFPKISACTTNVTCSETQLDIKGNKMSFFIPSASSGSSLPVTAPRYSLTIEIPFLYDDLSSVIVNFWFFKGFAASPVDSKPEEECINYFCKFVFWDKKEKRPACYGFVTADGCGLSKDRYGELGAWDESIEELTQQIFEDSPFFMSTK